jgi:hypothetical protein
VSLSRLDLITSVGSACDLGSAAVFVGAGLSRASGMPDWKELLEGPRKESGIPMTPEMEADLPLLAEYVLVEGRYSADRLNQHIFEQLMGSGNMPNALHRAIARLPVDQIWTTNYDPLIEQVAADSEVVALDEHVRQIGSTRRAIIKMHGSISFGPPAAWESPPVITRTHYERYETDRPRTWALLQAAYLSKTILFVGFSFSDPNIEILQRLSRIHDTAASNRHVTIMRRPPEGKADERRVFDLRLRDLEQSGIRVHQIDDHGQLEPILTALVRRTRPAQVFISGSDQGVGDHTAVCNALGVALADKTGWRLCSLEGPSGWRTTNKVAGIRRAEGTYAASSLQFYYRRKNEPPPPLDERVGTVVFTDLEREDLVAELLDESRAVVAVGGGDRTREEIARATTIGAGVVPLPAAGGAAKEYWTQHKSAPPDLGGQKTSATTWDRLGDSDLAVATRAAVELLEQAMYSTGTRYRS